MSYWMWAFYVGICFLFCNAAIAGLLGLAGFQLASAFLIILQLTSGTSPHHEKECLDK